MLRVRFAPSPTGYLHIGSARTFIFNWLYARRNHGTMVLRIDDTDVDRNTQASLDSKRTLRVLERRTQSQDHPILLTVPETLYLKCLILEVV